jgi:hypothetical protein
VFCLLRLPARYQTPSVASPQFIRQISCNFSLLALDFLCFSVPHASLVCALAVSIGKDIPQC